MSQVLRGPRVLAKWLRIRVRATWRVFADVDERRRPRLGQDRSLALDAGKSQPAFFLVAGFRKNGPRVGSVKIAKPTYAVPLRGMADKHPTDACHAVLVVGSDALASPQRRMQHVGVLRLDMRNESIPIHASGNVGMHQADGPARGFQFNDGREQGNGFQDFLALGVGHG